MNASQYIIDNPPRVSLNELLKVEVGMENPEERCGNAMDTAVLVVVNDCGMPSLGQSFNSETAKFRRHRTLSVGGSMAADFLIPVKCAETPIQLMWHLAVKLVLNTISTGTMVVMGRVTGNWMSWVAISNKKLIDRAIRLVAELGGLDYRTAAVKLFEAEETIAANARPDEEPPCVVQTVLKSLGVQNGNGAECGA